MKALALLLLIALGLQSCYRDPCRQKIPKSRDKMIKKLKRQYNYKPYKI